MWILHFQCLASSAFGLPRARLKTCLPPVHGNVTAEGWLFTALLPKGTDAAAVRWDKYNGVNVAKHLGDFLVWHI